MAATPTDFHDPEKELKEYIIIPTDPGIGTDAVDCCKCVEESYCRSESTSSVFSYTYGAALVYVSTS